MAFDVMQQDEYIPRNTVLKPWRQEDHSLLENMVAAMTGRATLEETAGGPGDEYLGQRPGPYPTEKVARPSWWGQTTPIPQRSSAMVMAAPDAAPGGVAAPSVRELNQDPRNLAAWEAAQKQYQDFMENEFELTPQAAAKRVMLAQKVGQLGKIYREGTAGEKQLGELEARKYAAAAAENQLEEAAARKAGAAGGGAMFDTNAIINAMREDYERQKQMKKES